ncbi:MAG: hypothetical protein ACJ71W_10650 [Terriglobales bacterium]
MATREPDAAIQVFHSRLRLHSGWLLLRRHFTRRGFFSESGRTAHAIRFNLVSLAWALRADLRRKEGVLFSIFFAVLKGRSSTTTPRFLLDK